MGRLGSDHRQMQQIAAHALRTSFQLKIRQRVVGWMRDSAGRETLQADTSALCVVRTPDDDWSSSDDDELYVEVEDYSMYMKEVDFLSNTRNVRRRIGGDV